MVSNLRKNILIVGYGSIGQRHFQSLQDLSNVNIYVVDLKKNNQIQKNILKNKNFFFFKRLNLIKIKNFDFVIIATNSDTRFNVFKKISEKFIVKNILFEKFLFYKKYEYTKASSILRKKKIRAWVNCPRRLQSFYIYLKKKIKKNSFNITYLGNNWEMASNTIHFIDLFCFLSSTKTISLSKINLNKKIFKSKRKNFCDFFGEIEFNNSNNCTMKIVNSKKIKKNLFIIEFKNKKIIINEGLNQIKENNRIKKWHFSKQSELTGYLFNTLDSKNAPKLIRFNESAKHHLFFLQIIHSYFNNFKLKIT